MSVPEPPEVGSVTLDGEMAIFNCGEGVGFSVSMIQINEETRGIFITATRPIAFQPVPASLSPVADNQLILLPKSR